MQGTLYLGGLKKLQTNWRKDESVISDCLNKIVGPPALTTWKCCKLSHFHEFYVTLYNDATTQMISIPTGPFWFAKRRLWLLPSMLATLMLSPSVQ